MQISINLLPHREKAIIRRALRMHMILAYGSLIVLVPVVIMGVLALLLVATRIEQRGLAVTRDLLHQQGSMQEMERADYTIAQTNRAARRAQKMMRSQQHPAEILSVLSAYAPRDVQVTRLVINGDNVTVQGTAAQRQSVITFKQRLEASGCFTQLVLPLTSLVDRRDTDFTITAQKIPCS